jgi:hypothetical protein
MSHQAIIQRNIPTLCHSGGWGYGAGSPGHEKNQGGFVVSAEFKDGKVTSTTIERVANKNLPWLSPWKTISINGKLKRPLKKTPNKINS